MNHQEQGERKGLSPSNRLWVPFVVLVGALIGSLLYIIQISDLDYIRRFPFEPLGLATFIEFHIILSTIGISLLVALVVVYLRMYRETKANFVLGLLVMLFALLLHSILTSPVFEDFMVRLPLRADLSSPIADVFTVVAYGIFLYLSLE